MSEKETNLGGTPPIFKLNNEQKKIISIGKHANKTDDLKNVSKKILSIKDILGK